MELWKVNMGVVTINGEEVVSSGQVYLDTGMDHLSSDQGQTNVD